MAELVDSLTGGASSAASGEATAPSDRGEAGAGGHKNLDQRLEELRGLAKQKNEMQRQWGEMTELVSSLREQVAELKGRTESSHTQGSQTSGAIQSWSDLSDGDLAKAFEMGLAPRDDGNPANAPAAFQSIAEFIRRQTEKTQQTAAEQARSEVANAQQQAVLEAQIKKDFGDEAFNTESDLFQRANEYAARMQQQYGKDVLQKMPQMAHAVFAYADRDLRMGDRDKLLKTETELRRLKEQQSMETNLGVSPRNAEVAEALQQKDPRAAIAALNITKSFDRR